MIANIKTYENTKLPATFYFSVKIPFAILYFYGGSGLSLTSPYSCFLNTDICTANEQENK
jgi:hypothetical protein